jgi:hypothetical protein
MRYDGWDYEGIHHSFGRNLIAISFTDDPTLPNFLETLRSLFEQGPMAETIRHPACSSSTPEP